MFGIGRPQFLPQPLGILHHPTPSAPSRRAGWGLASIAASTLAMFSTRRDRKRREHTQRQPSVGHRDEHRRRVAPELNQLHAHAFTGKLIEAVAAGDAGLEPFAVGVIAGTVGGMEAEEAQDANILTDALAGIADEAHAPRFEVPDPPHSRRRFVGAREKALIVKSRRSASAFQSRPKATLAWRPSVSASWRGVVTSNGAFVGHRGDGAMLNSRGHRLEAGRLHTAHDLLGVAVVATSISSALKPEERVAHRAADHARFFAVAVEHAEQARQRAPR